MVVLQGALRDGFTGGIPEGRQDKPTAEEILTPVSDRYNFYTMKFEFDGRKSRSNQKKHGIDFIEAQQLWNDPDLIAVPAKTADEPRILIVGKIEGPAWSAIITYRDDRLRIISVRRSRSEEIELYEG